VEGAAGSSLRLGRGLHRIAARYARSRAGSEDGVTQLLACMSDSVVRAGGDHSEGAVEAAGEWSGRGGRSRLPEFVGKAIRSEIATAGAVRTNEDAGSFRLAARIGQRLAIESLWRSVGALRAGEVAAALDAAPALLPAALAVAPYVVAWRSHHKNEPLVRAVADRFPAARLLRERSGRTAWFCDTSAADAAAATFVHALEIAGGAERLQILHLPGAAIEGSPARCELFQPLGDFGRLGGGTVSLQIPPVLDLIEHCERGRFDRVLISSAGPMAAAARCVAWCLELEVIAVLTRKDASRSPTRGASSCPTRP
jgi:hypothetical protein